MLDQADLIRGPLQQVLIGGYMPNISENALQLLYWSGRINCGMEEQLSDVEKLRDVLAQRLPAGAQLPGANLQTMVLEAAALTNVNCNGADLSKANLRSYRLSDENRSFEQRKWLISQARSCRFIFIPI